MSDRSVVFIVNPIAGGGLTKASLPSIKQFCEQNQISYEIYESEYYGHAVEIARSFAQTDKTVCAVGGDGTVSEVLTGLMNGKASLAILPYGSGNDIATSFQINKENALE